MLTKSLLAMAALTLSAQSSAVPCLWRTGFEDVTTKAKCETACGGASDMTWADAVSSINNTLVNASDPSGGYIPSTETPAKCSCKPAGHANEDGCYLVANCATAKVTTNATCNTVYCELPKYVNSSLDGKYEYATAKVGDITVSTCKCNSQWMCADPIPTTPNGASMAAPTLVGAALVAASLLSLLL